MLSKSSTHSSTSGTDEQLFSESVTAWVTQPKTQMAFITLFITNVEQIIKKNRGWTVKKKTHKNEAIELICIVLKCLKCAFNVLMVLTK